jgi:hypothetical protein
MYFSLLRFFHFLFGYVIIVAIAVCKSTFFICLMFLGSFLSMFFICFSLYCFDEICNFVQTGDPPTFVFCQILSSLSCYHRVPFFVLYLALWLSRFLNLSRIWRCLLDGVHLGTLFQLFQHGSMQHIVFLDFVVRWSSPLDPQSSV